MKLRLMTDNPRDQAFEIMMQTHTGYAPRGGGTFIKSHFNYTADDCSCKNCRYGGKNKCKVQECICFDERLEAGCVPYDELILRLLQHITDKPLKKRIQLLLPDWNTQSGFFYAAEHEHNMKSATQNELAPNISAALYLLTSNEFLWSRSKRHISSKNIAFENFNIRGIEIDTYPLYHVAKGMYFNQSNITVLELADKELITDDALRLILNAFIVKKFGSKVLKYHFKEVSK